MFTMEQQLQPPTSGAKKSEALGPWGKGDRRDRGCIWQIIVTEPDEAVKAGTLGGRVAAEETVGHDCSTPDGINAKG